MVSAGDGQRLSQTRVSVIGDHRSAIDSVRGIGADCHVHFPRSFCGNSGVSHIGQNSEHDVETSGYHSRAKQDSHKESHEPHDEHANLEA